jgi:hypothetical protein
MLSYLPSLISLYNSLGSLPMTITLMEIQLPMTSLTFSFRLTPSWVSRFIEAIFLACSTVKLSILFFLASLKPFSIPNCSNMRADVDGVPTAISHFVKDFSIVLSKTFPQIINSCKSDKSM